MELYADIILPLPLNKLYTYLIPSDMDNNIQIGMRVIVNIGKTKFYTGIIYKIHNNKPEVDNIKPIVSILDNTPSILPYQLKFWEFISTYYCCTLGEVYKAAIPSALQIKSECFISLSKDYDGITKFSPKEYTIIDLLSDNKNHNISELHTNQIRTLKKLIEQGVISYNEVLTKGYHLLYTDFVILEESYKNTNNIHSLLNSLKKAPKQQKIVETYIAFCTNEYETIEYKAIEKSKLLENSSATTNILSQLINKNVFRIIKKKRYRHQNCSQEEDIAHILSAEQERALQQINHSFKTYNTTLLYGVTSSGKTEIYIKLIETAIRQGKQVMMLLPELAITQHLSNRLKKIFGSKMCVYHSRLNNNERAEIYNHQLTSTPYQIIIGTRLSVFLPYQNLGLIIIDEEHDMSYKQFDPAPRYNCRDIAIYLAHLFEAKCLLGTATPSIESYSNCHFKKYGLVTLPQRYQCTQLPTIKLIDLKECYKKRSITGHFSFELLEKIKKTLANKQQVILFQNRRGYSPYIECRSCGYIPKCPNCDVSLTYHKFTNSLTCHYCGYTQTSNSTCKMCNQQTLHTIGFGTEQVETEIKSLLPTAKVERMDADSVRTMNSLDKLMDAFENNQIDILIGTQIVAKGIDFNNVGLVGILNADNMLNAPDFRAYERAYQMLVQVSGRTGRRFSQGEVIIQTSQPNNPIIQQIQNNNFQQFFAEQMIERSTFNYPPYQRIINITIKNYDKGACINSAIQLRNILFPIFGNRIIGPDTPLIEKIQNKFIRNIVVKLEITLSITQAKKILTTEISKFAKTKGHTNTIFSIDVDPM